MIGVFAPLGSYIPGSKITLEKKPVRGVVSNGMLCSGASSSSPTTTRASSSCRRNGPSKVGERYVDVAGPRRSRHRGEADAQPARLHGRARHRPRSRRRRPRHAEAGAEDRPSKGIRLPDSGEARVRPETANACPVFAGRYIRGVNNGPSPAWLQQRLKAVGLRPINALVDVTNYISLDRGRPLHVYDADKFSGAIRARLGKPGEKFVGLDGKTHAVDETMCVIADDTAPLGFGGIIGGEATGCTEATKNVLIECAYFDPLRTAATGRKTGLVTDARYRFERGVDPASVRPGLDLATDMMLKVCGGKPSKAKVAGKRRSRRPSSPSTSRASRSWRASSSRGGDPRL